MCGHCMHSCSLCLTFPPSLRVPHSLPSSHRNVVLPYFSDVVTLSPSNVEVHGVAHGVLSLALAPGSLLCVVAAPGTGTPFLGSVSLHLQEKGGAWAVTCARNDSVSTSGRVCATVPPLDLLCGNTVCNTRGECGAHAPHPMVIQSSSRM
jgi:hypothetical protein